MAENANMRMNSLTLCERRGHGDLHSIQTAEVTAGVQSHNPSCVTVCSGERKGHIQFKSAKSYCFSKKNQKKQENTGLWHERLKDYFFFKCIDILFHVDN